MMSLASDDVDAGASGITWLKSHVESHFDLLELTTAAVLLMMLSVSCDSNTGITSPKSHVEPCFNHLNLTNNRVLLAMP